MLRIRWVEERIAEIYHTDRIKSPVHLSIGQEAPSVGLCEALERKDAVFGTYRSHALYLAKGGDLNAMVAELFGKATGCAKGKGGSMHLGDRRVGMMGTSAIVGTTVPQAVGYALGESMKKRNAVSAVCFGDGAMEEGVFHESLNFAALMRLPVVFLCENNFYAIHTPLEKRVPNADFCARARTYGIPADTVESNDVLRTRRAALEAVARARAGDGPSFIEVQTYRWREHVGPSEDWQLGYRNRADAEAWIAGDELQRIGTMLGAADRDAIAAAVAVEIDAAFAFAEASPFPDAAELYTDVYAD